jgi:hypothetical protein
MPFYKSDMPRMEKTGNKRQIIYLYFGWMHPVACIMTKYVKQDLLSQLRSNVYLLSRITHYMFRLSSAAAFF